MFNKLFGTRISSRWGLKPSPDYLRLPSRYFDAEEYLFMTTIKFKKIHPNAQIPIYGTEGAAGFDFKSVEAVIINSGETKLVKLGLQCEFPEGFELQVRPRSGLALKNGITVLNSPGTVDADYRGELGVILINHSKVPFSIGVGDRIAQGVLNKFEKASFEEVEELSDTARGPGGYGSTGTR